MIFKAAMLDKTHLETQNIAVLALITCTVCIILCFLKKSFDRSTQTKIHCQPTTRHLRVS